MKFTVKLFIFLAGISLFLTGCGESEKKNTPQEYSINGVLVSPAWVNKLINYHETGSTSEAPLDYTYDRNHKYLVFETSWGPVADASNYNAGHVKGAIHSDSDIYENGDPRWFLLPDADIKTAMGSMGITADTTVIVYSKDPSFAARLWWILKYAGLTDVKLMDGGYEKWAADGFETDTAINNPESATYTGTMNTDFIASQAYVSAHYNDDDVILADVREEEEYNGTTSGYDYIIAMGRIFNAEWFKPVGGSDNEYYNADNTLKSIDEIKNLWEGLGLTQGTSADMFNKEVIFYCGGGYRSSLAFFYAYMMGYKNMKNYSDGWSGWSTEYTYVGSAPCGPDDGAKHGAWASDYCQKPSGRAVQP